MANAYLSHFLFTELQSLTPWLHERFTLAQLQSMVFRLQDSSGIVREESCSSHGSQEEGTEEEAGRERHPSGHTLSVFSFHQAHRLPTHSAPQSFSHLWTHETPEGQFRSMSSIKLGRESELNIIYTHRTTSLPNSTYKSLID